VGGKPGRRKNCPKVLLNGGTGRSWNGKKMERNALLVSETKIDGQGEEEKSSRTGMR